MEKRLILAALLSFAILYFWSGLTPPAKPISTGTENPQNIRNKELTSNMVEKQVLLSPQEMAESVSAPLVASHVIEKVKIIENEKLVVKFSNIGGVIDGIKIKGYDFSFPLIGISAIQGFERAEFEMEENGPLGIVFSRSENGLTILKKYVLSKNDYTIRSEIEILEDPEMSSLRPVAIKGFEIDMSNLDVEENEKTQANTRDKSLNEYVINASKEMWRKASAYKFTEKDDKVASDAVTWLGFRDRYYCALIRPDKPASAYEVKTIDKRHLSVGYSPLEEKSVTNGKRVFSSTIYAGPEDLDILKSYKVGFEKIRRYYRFGVFDAIAKAIYQVMHILHKIIPNWGVSIILISIVIYFSMYPLTMKSMTSMKKMQAVQPKLLKLKEKHKNNPQKLNKEMMELYKEHGVNPLGGCLPMVFQMPVFIGLYQVLWRDVSFNGAKFLWIKDLSQPDRLFILPVSLPFIGNELNLLPIVMIVVMFFQMKLSSKNMVVSDPSQAAQQKMIGTIMPVFMGVIFYKFASGLTLYFAMFYIFSTFTQWKMSKAKGALL